MKMTYPMKCQRNNSSYCIIPIDLFFLNLTNHQSLIIAQSLNSKTQLKVAQVFLKWLLMKCLSDDVMDFCKTMLGQINDETSIWSEAIVLGVVQISPPTKRNVVFYR